MAELIVRIPVDAIWLPRSRQVIGAPADHRQLPWFDGSRDRNGSVPHLASAINAEPFSEHVTWLEAGVHLHWTLPDGLTRGTTRRSAERPVRVGDLWFAPAPNRWLVAKRLVGDDARVIDRVWLVESDHVHPDGAGPNAGITLPRTIDVPERPPWLVIGRQIELHPRTMEPLDRGAALIAQASSLPSQEPALTALGPGDPLFAAHYPSCRSVFGCHDDGATLGRAALYSVFGWYSQDVVDPLANLGAALHADPRGALGLLARKAHKDGTAPPPADPASLDEAQWQAALWLGLDQRFGWAVEPDDRPGVFPDHLVCAGTARITAGLAVSDSAPPAGGRVGIGSSAAEAFAALLMHPEQPLSAADELELVQTLAATDLSAHPLDLGAKLAEARHTEQFRPSRGHSVWTLRPPEAGDPATTRGAAGQGPLSDELARELNLLNALQEQYDQARDAIGALRQALFGDWHCYMTLAYPESDLNPFAVDVDAVRERIERSRLEPLEALAWHTGQLFHGRNANGSVVLDDHPPTADSGPLPHGPTIGSAAGRPFDDALTAGEALRGVVVWAGEIVDEVQLVGAATAFPRRCAGGDSHPGWLLDGEHITAVFGETGSWAGAMRIARFGFETSHGRRFGPWGRAQAQPAAFRIDAPDRMVIVGIRGRVGDFVEALGVLVAPPSHLAARETPHDTLARRVVEQHRTVLSRLDESAPAGQVPTLAPAPGPRYWRPNDPVIALPALPALALQRGRGEVGVSAGRRPVLASGLGGDWARAGRAYAGETRAPRWDWRDILHLVDGAFGDVESDGENWRALQLEWEVELRPLAETGLGEGGRLAGDFVEASQTLPIDGPDLVGRPGLERARTGQYMAGRSILNPTAWRLLQDRFAEVPDAIRRQLGAPPDNAMVLPLGGFHDLLLMQRNEPQLPIVDPVGLPGQRSFTGRVRAALGRHHPTTPLPEGPFHPIRSGDLVIERLRVIDAFGRSKTWRPDRVATTVRMRPEPSAPRDHATLPLRLAQSARLDFRWLSAFDGAAESNSHPASSPVCGWLLPNELDGSVALYARSGHGLGAVGADGRWQSAPGDALAPRSPDEIIDPALRRIARWLTQATSATDAVSDFLAALDAALQQIDPKDAAQHQPRALLIGRPVAVARARLRLALQHPAAIDQSMAALRARVAGGGDDDHGLGEVRIGVRLGEHGQFDDGLCGYWIEDGPALRDDRFMTPHGVDLGVGITDPRIRLIDRGEPLAGFPLRLTPDGPAETLTLLLDPRSSVHASCGILPTKSIRIPPDQFAGPIAALRATFVSGPVLGPAAEVALPLPAEPGFAWSWIDRVDAHWREVPHHPTVHRAELVAGFGTVGAALWDRLVALGRIVPEDHPDVGVLMPEPADAAAARFDDLGLSAERVERGMHDLARSIVAAGLEARYDARAVARDGWLQLRRSPLALPGEEP